MDFTNFYNVEGSITANTPDTVLAPAANVNGALIFNMMIADTASGATQSAFIAKVSAPASITDGANLFAGRHNGVSSSDIETYPCYYTDEPVQVPAGQGIYFIAKSTRTIARTALIKIL